MPNSTTTRTGEWSRTTPSPVRGRTTLARREAWQDVVLIGPALALVVLFVLIPIVIAVYLSMTNWDGFTFPPKWIGAANYLRMFQDPDVVHAAGVTALIAVTGAVACNVLGLGVALLVNRNTRINTVLRVLVFYPYVVGPIIVGFLWASILGTNGALNSLLESSGSERVPFLSSPGFALASSIAVIVWTSFGINVVLYLAGLQTIPDSLIEAARIDGASAWQIFWRVKLPVLAATVTLNVVLAVVGLLRVYELLLTLTAGGPAGSTETVVFSILTTSFNQSKLGYSAAQSVVLMTIIVLVSVSILRLRRRSDEAVAA